MNLNKEYLLENFGGDKLKDYLNGVIDGEIKKSEAMDAELVGECVDWLLELKGIEIDIPEEEIKRKAASVTKKRGKPKKKIFYFAYAASFFIVVWLGFETVAVTAFNNNFFDGTALLSRAIVAALTGNEIRQGDTSRIASGSRDYESIEKLSEAENVGIIVPGWLPNGIEAASIKYLYDFDYGQINILYSDNTTSLVIKLNSRLNSAEDFEIYENDNIIFYLSAELNLIVWEHNEKLYTLACGFDITEHTDKIIRNIKINCCQDF